MGPRRLLNRNKRVGSIAFEALLVVPVLLLIIAALVEFALVVSAEQKLAEASGLAARVGSTGRSEDDIKQAVKTVLGTKQYERATVYTQRRNDPHTGSVIEVRVELPAKVVSLNLLHSIGLDLSGETLTGRTVMRME
jgi:Flp pilus assembly protein TadG